ncbi:MipA/OmpV family protein [Qipengyuania sp. MTN3-11]|uniref:MipA/OmpV family protein n=1 Tax=Qipengyuania sp. MTN3-11 TaxID=3056557 RepID=UPI0036F40F4E
MIGRLALVGATLAFASPLAAQEAGDDDTTPPSYEGTVFDGDYLSVGAGIAYVPSYDGSDDYVISPLPIVQGSLGGVDINPRPGGVALDFIPDSDGSVDLSLGIAGRLQRNRASQIEDPVVRSLGELDTAIEVGPTAGISFPGVLNPYDSLSFSSDVRWDVAGAHEGMVVAPSVTYFTPLSRGIAASLTVSTNHVDGDYADYYYSVSPADSLVSGLPTFDADGGFKDVGVTLFMGFDLDGDVTNGGLAIAAIAGYSRLLGDFEDTPFTSIRGSADQFLVGVGLGYTY